MISLGPSACGYLIGLPSLCRYFSGTPSYFQISRSSINPFSPATGFGSKAYTNPSPAPKKTISLPFTFPKPGEDQLQCSKFWLIPEASSPKSAPVFLSKATKHGANGEGMFKCDQSCPLEVVAKSLFPAITTELLAMLCGNTPNSDRISNTHKMSASVTPGDIGGFPSPAIYFASSWNGPSLPSLSPSASKQSTSHRLETT